MGMAPVEAFFFWFALPCLLDARQVLADLDIHPDRRRSTELQAGQTVWKLKTNCHFKKSVSQ